VPIFAESLGCIATTQSDIHQAIKFLSQQSEARVADRPWFTGHYEVETYAWSVLPESMAATDLTSGIISELEYFRGLHT
jgi:hypothetical protein